MAANRRDKTVSPNQPCDLPEALRHLAFWLGVSGELSNRFGSPSPKTPGNAIVWSIIDRSADSGNRPKEAETGGVLCSRISWSRCRLGALCEGPAQGRKVHCRISTSLTDVTQIARMRFSTRTNRFCCFVKPVAQTRRALDPRQIALRAFEQRVAGLEILLCHLSGGKPPIKRLPDLMAIQPLYSGCRCYCHDGTRSPRCRMPLLLS
jgi:hypothetical protein